MQEYQPPEEIMKACNLHSKINNNKIYMRIDKGMHGLQEVGVIK